MVREVRHVAVLARETSSRCQTNALNGGDSINLASETGDRFLRRSSAERFHEFAPDTAWKTHERLEGLDVGQFGSVG